MIIHRMTVGGYHLVDHVRLDGVLETAFMVEYPDSYLGKFDRLGTLAADTAGAGR